MTDKLPDLKGLTILIADDDRPSVRSLEESLGNFGAHVVTALNEQAAHDALSRGDVDVILISIDLMNGPLFEEVRNYRSGRPGGFLYIMTGQGETAEPAPGSGGLSADDYIQ